MLSTIRSAAIHSVRRSDTVVTPFRRAVPALAARRMYASENGADRKTEAVTEQVKKAEESTTATADANSSEKGESDNTAKLLAEKDKKIAELQDAYIRCLADQENLRERTRKEIAAAHEFAIQKFAKDLLDTVDILNMALTAVPSELHNKEAAVASEIAKDAAKLADHISNLYTGVSMTETELVKTLKRHGVEQDNPEGHAFNPNKHQALFQTPMPGKEAGTIFVVQKLGYTLKGRVLRPAQVGVVADTQ